MATKIRNTFFILILSKSLWACASGEGAKIKVSEGVDVISLGSDGTRQTLSPGGEAKVLRDPLLFEKKGFSPVYIIPLEVDKYPEVDLKLKPSAKWEPEDVAARINDRLSEILFEVDKVYGLLNKKKFTEAEAASRDLFNSNLDIPYLGFLRASCLILAGKKNEALAPLEKALEVFPNESRGRSLYKTVTGRDWIQQTETKSVNAPGGTSVDGNKGTQPAQTGGGK